MKSISCLQTENDILIQIQLYYCKVEGPYRQWLSIEGIGLDSIIQQVLFNKIAMQATSLPVPSVQELVKQTITKVPERYVQSNQDPILLSNTNSLPQVPVIDLYKLLSDDTTELEKLDHACREWGFFQVSLVFCLV